MGRSEIDHVTFNTLVIKPKAKNDNSNQGRRQESRDKFLSFISIWTGAREKNKKKKTRKKKELEKFRDISRENQVPWCL